MATAGVRKLLAVVVFASVAPAAAAAQETGAPTRQAVIEQEQAAKETKLHPYVPNRAEEFLNRYENRVPRWHPFLENAYSGGGLALGLGYIQHVSGYNTLDVRGSYSIKSYKRAEVEFVARRLFQRRAELTLLGGWREATEVGFYGTGMATSVDDRANYGFRQPQVSAAFTIFPTRRLFMLAGGAEWSEWDQRPGRGSAPSVDAVYTPATLPGLGAKVAYLHTQGTVGLDWRTSPGYSRRGGYYGITLHDFRDNDSEFGFRRVDYEAIQHIPILREAWVLSLRGRVSTALDKSGEQIPFFMLPSVGGGSSLRGYSSWRFRDENSLLLQAEWRIMANRYLDAAFFYDAGKVTARRSDLDFDGLKSDFGFGVRLHSPFSTPLRIEVAKSREGHALIFSSSAAF